MSFLRRNYRACVLIGIDLVLLSIALPYVNSMRVELDRLAGTPGPTPATVDATFAPQPETPAGGERRRILLRPETGADPTPKPDPTGQAADSFINEVRRRAKEDPRAAMLWIQNEAPGPERLRGMLEVVELWAVEDSQDALLWLESNAEGTARLKTLRSGMTQWAGTDPEAAAAWVAGMANDGSKVAAAETLVAEWAARDPRTAVQWVARLPLNRVRDKAAAALVTAWADSDPEAATVWALSEAEFNGNVDLLNASIRRFTAADPERADNFIRSMAEAYDAPGAVEAYVETLAQQAPAAAAHWMDTLAADDPIFSIDHARVLLKEWSRSDSVAASVWLSEQEPGPKRDAAIQGFAETMIAYEPEAVAAWTNTLSDPHTRLTALDSSIRTWAADDPAAALEWLQHAELEADIRERLSADIIEHAE